MKVLVLPQHCCLSDVHFSKLVILKVWNTSPKALLPDGRSSEEEGSLRDPRYLLSGTYHNTHACSNTCSYRCSDTCTPHLSLCGTSAKLYSSPLHLSMSNLPSIDPPLRSRNFPQSRCQASITHIDVFNKNAIRREKKRRRTRRRRRRRKKGHSSYGGETWRKVC